MVISEVPFEYKNMIYQLGKHHRKPLSDSGAPFGTLQSDSFGFPVPEWADSYKEIRIKDNLDLGSHMLLWGEVINVKYLNESHGHLYHIHFLHFLHQMKAGLSYKLV
jgi:flavin reductase (DIM6/NTAB) family NADH-FMN oxidoreductase RutF